MKEMKIWMTIVLLVTLLACTFDETQIVKGPGGNNAGRNISVVPKRIINNNLWGNYYALIVGINSYYEFNPLKTAVKDAKVLRKELIDNYGFARKNITFLTNAEATRSNFINKLRYIASKLSEKDNFLIYFAGHGNIDKLEDEGYWIPIEGKKEDVSSFISLSRITKILSSEKVRAKNIMVVADSCYSGKLLRTGRGIEVVYLDDVDYKYKLQRLASKKSRQVITSGGLEEVLDSGRDGHSLFAYYFLKALRENDRDVIDLENLFHTYIWKYVAEIADQTPQIGRLKTPMDEDGQFVLVKSKIGSQKASLKITANVYGSRVYINNIYKGTTDITLNNISTGTYQIKVSKNGYQSYRDRIKLTSGQKLEVPANLEKISTSGSIYVFGKPEGAKVYLDGYLRGNLPCTVEKLEHGSHKLLVKHKGYKNQIDKSLFVQAGKQKEIKVELKENTGRLFVYPDPDDADIKILNLRPNYYRSGIKLKPGRYHIQVSKKGYETVTRWIGISGGEDKSIGINMELIPVPPSVQISSQPAKTERLSEWKDPITGMDFVWIPKGCFKMGSPESEKDRDSDEGPVHEVCVDGFWMGKYEVTVGQYMKFVKATDSNYPEWLEKGSSYNINTGNDNYYKKLGKSLTSKNHPIVGVSWNNGKKFIKWLNDKNSNGDKFRLPTEAEWEYACRAGTTTPFYFGETISTDQANYDGNYIYGNGKKGIYRKKTTPVGSFPENAFGLFDMHGNIWEWCQDIYSSSAYSKHQRFNPIYANSGSDRVIRGGSWGDLPRGVRCANRYDGSPGDRYLNVGFRLVRTP
ncbi:formylglycine-generating enzyme [Candidatus Magnetomoraceae bacterium gMMP-15]